VFLTASADGLLITVALTVLMGRPELEERELWTADSEDPRAS